MNIMIIKEKDRLSCASQYVQRRELKIFIIISTCKVDYLRESLLLTSTTPSRLSIAKARRKQQVRISSLTKFHSCMVKKEKSFPSRINFPYMLLSAEKKSKIFLCKFTPHSTTLEHHAWIEAKGIFLQDNFNRKCRRLVPPEPWVFLPP